MAVTRAKALGAFALFIPAFWSSAGAQGNAPRATLRKALQTPELWGPGFPVLVQALGGWTSSGDARFIAALDALIGVTPHRTADEASRAAARFQAAFAKSVPAAGRFRSLAAEGRKTQPTIAARRYVFDGSFRVAVLTRAPAFAPNLTLTVVRRILGAPEATRRLPPIDAGGEARPLELTDYVYAGGALVYQSSNYAPTPDSVFHVVIDAKAALGVVKAQ